MDNGNCFLKLRSSFYDKKLFETFIISESGKTYRYAELELRSSQYARFLRKKGIKAGDRICIRLENTFDMVCLYIACLRSGAVFVPIKSTLGTNEMEYIIQGVQASFLFFPVSQSNLFKNLPAHLWSPGIDTCSYGLQSELAKQSKFLLPLFAVQERKDEDIACISYTSGTTGKPKGIMLSHKSFSLGLKTLAKLWEFSPEDTLLFPLALSHNLGFFAFNLALYSGSQIILMEVWNINLIAKLLSKSTVFFGTPLIYKQLLSTGLLSTQSLVGCRLLVSGTSFLSESLYNEFYQVTGKRIVDRYGMTETIANTSNNIHTPIPGSCGKPLPGVSLRVVDDIGGEVAVGDIGSIEIKSPYLFSGYWNDKEKTKEAFTGDGYFITGDVGKIDVHGNVWLMARSKEVIFTVFGKVYPREIELYIEEIGGVEAVAVLGVPHPKMNECPIAVIEKGNSAYKLEEDYILKKLKELVSPERTPKKIFFIETLPRNETGKIQKSILFERYKNTFLE